MINFMCSIPLRMLHRHTRYGLVRPASCISGTPDCKSHKSFTEIKIILVYSSHPTGINLTLTTFSLSAYLHKYLFIYQYVRHILFTFSFGHTRIAFLSNWFPKKNLTDIMDMISIARSHTFHLNAHGIFFHKKKHFLKSLAQNSTKPLPTTQHICTFTFWRIIFAN